jgi:allantoin racemase
MRKRIMFLNIYRGDVYDRDYERVVAAAKSADSDVDVWSFPRRTDGSEGDIFHQLRLHRYESLTLADTLALIYKAEQAGYDGAVIGCFNDPGLAEGREVARNMVVAAPCEATLRIATTLGRKFSILATHKSHFASFEDNVTRYGLRDRLASLRTIEMPTEALQQDLDETAGRLIDVAQRTVREDRADVLILGCTNYFGLYARVQEAVGVPVLDPVISALRWCEFLIDLRDRQGWKYRHVLD